jgi:acetyl esterase/lipase
MSQPGRIPFLRRNALRGLALATLWAAGALALPGCTAVAFGIANVPALVGNYERHAGLRYAAGPRHSLDVYVPYGAALAPVVVFWYGGAWTSGDKADYRFVGASLAAAGYVVVIPDYRLFPRARFPEFVDDGAAALRWTHDQVARYGGDPARIWLMGHSAGAHQAALLALDEHRLAASGVPRTAIRGLIGLSGPYALEPNSDELRAIFAAPWTPADWQPVRFVTPGAPPALLLHGGADDVVVPAHSERLAQALRDAGVSVEHQVFAGRRHADTVAALSRPGRSRAPVQTAIQAFIERTGVASSQ